MLDQFLRERIRIFGSAGYNEAMQFLLVDQTALAETGDKGFQVLSLWFRSEF